MPLMVWSSSSHWITPIAMTLSAITISSSSSFTPYGISCSLLATGCLCSASCIRCLILVTIDIQVTMGFSIRQTPLAGHEISSYQDTMYKRKRRISTSHYISYWSKAKPIWLSIKIFRCTNPICWIWNKGRVIYQRVK
ncbi:uncharacterized protein LOC127128276 isoform X3 [Lathyrus oleraceus]|uniref:uncharacterized protein LOC127128276 isoform X3 n=1 Tax=Pisum sativum TaxID=3888 RepID=UPI0021CFF739|nr:uncharacterized protein LOC127128276 isoform X3 [Pisum sativum]